MLRVYRAVVLQSQFYAYKTWTFYCLPHDMLQEYAPCHMARKCTQCESNNVTLFSPQLRWTGHVHRMNDNRLLKRLFYGELFTKNAQSVGRREHTKKRLLGYGNIYIRRTQVMRMRIYCLACLPLPFNRPDKYMTSK